MIKLESPLWIWVKKKKFSLNLNIYRNTHYTVLNIAKQNYKMVMSRQVMFLPTMERIKLEFVLYPKTRARMDLANCCCIHDKFIADALVDYGKIEDDDYLHVVESKYSFGKLDKKNPRVEIIITEIC